MLGLGTIINVAAIVVGGTFGVLVGHRLPERTRQAVTDALGLMTLVVAALNIAEILNEDYVAMVGGGGSVLVVLGALVFGGIVGSLLHIEAKLERFGSWIQSRFRGSGDRASFINAFVSTSILFAIGPLAFLGAMSDGMGDGIDQLLLKSTLDLFASIAFAASLGWGVVASAISVGIVQGAFTLLGVTAGSALSDGLIASISATGGVLLLGVGLRILNIRQIPVADLLPALIVAPVLTLVVSSF